MSRPVASLPKTFFRPIGAPRPPPPMTPEDLVRQLAEHHEQHLCWLRRRVRSTVAREDVEDVLQGAYGRALSALRDPEGALAFDDLERAEAWLRTIALNLALDLGRQRRGRLREGRERRLDPVSLEADGFPPLADAGVHLEDDVLESLERDARRRVIADAIAALDPKHRQILQLRYGRDLDPAAIMVLEGLNRRQWEGRHTRAVKALGRALARLQVSAECGRTRRLLRRRPGALLGPAHTPATDHVASCVACGAFARSAQFSLATLPLPMAIAAWRYDAAERLLRPRSADAADARGGDPAAPLSDLARAAGVKLVAVATAGAVGLSALVAGERMDAGAADAGADTSTPVRATRDAGLNLAAHETPAQALARSAREMARRRAQARRTATISGARAVARPSRSGRDAAKARADDRDTTRRER